MAAHVPRAQRTLQRAPAQTTLWDMRRSLCGGVVAALLLVALLLPLALGGGGGSAPGQWRALQSQAAPALTNNNIRAAVAQCLAESADGDCPNSPYGHIRDWDTSAITDMSNRARAVVLPACSCVRRVRLCM